MNVGPNLYRPSYSSPEVYQCCINKSGNSEFKESLKSLKSPSLILHSILKLKGGSDELTDEEQEKLINSILAKVPQSSDKETSINKLFKRVLKIIDPVISDQRFWRILSESQKPIKSQLPDPTQCQSTDILTPAKTGSKGSSIFVHGLVAPMPNRLTPSGLSGNHETLSKNIQEIERRTRLRRAEPLYPSVVLGDSYEYVGKQLERKALRHLKDFGISIEGKSIEEMAEEYKCYVENILRKPNLIIREDGTLNKREPTINIGDPESLGIVAFENNPLYDKHRFISSYPISPEAFDNFVETGNIGLSPEERQAINDELQRELGQAERERQNESSFRSSLPEDARICNNQLREVEILNQQLKEDPNFPLTEKEKNLIQRAEKYEQYKNEFYQSNPHIARDEL